MFLPLRVDASPVRPCLYEFDYSWRGLWADRRVPAHPARIVPKIPAKIGSGANCFSKTGPTARQPDRQSYVVDQIDLRSQPRQADTRPPYGLLCCQNVDLPERQDALIRATQPLIVCRPERNQKIAVDQLKVCLLRI